jgi:enoyl-[acyl-carrier-protein] reductase (NADH)
MRLTRNSTRPTRRVWTALPVGDPDRPDEIANTVLFLCSDLASAITARNTLSTGHAPPTAAP